MSCMHQMGPGPGPGPTRCVKRGSHPPKGSWGGSVRAAWTGNPILSTNGRELLGWSLGVRCAESE